MNMLQFPFRVLFDGDLCLESADAVRSAILTADAFGVVREKDESCVFVDQTRFNFICAEQDGKIKRRFISGLRGSIRLKNQLLFPKERINGLFILGKAICFFDLFQILLGIRKRCSEVNPQCL